MKKILLILLFAPTFASADTIIAESISEDTTWVASSSPYVVNGEIALADGAKLVIEPGVIVKFNNRSGITVHGKLIAEGNDQNWITLTSANEIPSVDDYWYLWFQASSTDSRLSYVDVSYAHTPLDFLSASLTLSNMRIHDVQYGINSASSNLILNNVEVVDGSETAFFAVKGSNMVINNSAARNVYMGIRSWDSVVSVYNTTIENTDSVAIEIFDSQFNFQNSTSTKAGFSSSIEIYDASLVSISGSVIDGGISDGIYIWGSDSTGRPTVSIVDSVIQNFLGSGVIIAGTNTISIEDSIISANSSGAEVYGGSFTISNSSISNNLDFGLVNWRNGTVNAANNWWGDLSGPYDASTTTPEGLGDVVYGSVLYDPWLKFDPFKLPTRNPVIIIPGIMGSILVQEDGSEVWMNLFKMALPGRDSYLETLELSNSTSSVNNLIATEILKIIDIPLFSRDLFDGLLSLIRSNGYLDNQDLFTFPYDWRLDLNILVQELKSKIDQVKNQTGLSKVNIIAHSMGGLLVKEYLRVYGESSIDLFIDIGTPHFGSPKSFITIMYGDTDIAILNKNTIKQISQNMPSVYQLLPSSDYFDDSDPTYKYYVFDGVDNSQRFTFDQTKDYLKSSGRNSALIDRADEFHQGIDDLDPADYGVKTYNIVGCGVPTLGQIYILEKKGDKYSYNIRMINGDGTVPLRSAEAMPAYKTYYGKGVQHALMPSASGIKDLVVSILNSENPDISPYTNISDSSVGCSIPDGKMVSFHSPIDLHVYDSSGNHTGPDQNGDIENEITGVVYEVIDDNKFAFLPDGTSYTVTGSSTDQGTFDLRIESIVNGEVATTTIFNDVAITQSTQTQFIVGASVPSEIFIDRDGDSVHESSHPVSTTTTGFLENTGKRIAEPVIVLPAIYTSRSSERRTELAKLSSPDLDSTQPVPSSKRETTKSLTPKYSTTSPIVTSIYRGDNVASIYKAFTQNVKGVFKRVWGWFKSKL